MKKAAITTISAGMVVLCAVPSEPQKTYYPPNYAWGVGHGDENIQMHLCLDRDKNGNVTLHYEKTPDSNSSWDKEACRYIYAHTPSERMLTITPNNNVTIEVEITAKSPAVEQILNNIVAHQEELVRCLKTSPKTTEEVDTCIDLYCKTWLQTRPSQYPKGSISPKQYAAFINKRWYDFATLISDFDLSAQKESDQITSFKVRGTINTKEVEAIAHSDEKRREWQATKDLLRMHTYIDPHLFIPHMVVRPLLVKNKDVDGNHASVRIKKFDITNS